MEDFHPGIQKYSASIKEKRKSKAIPVTGH
jgi:hypothetical protein